MPTLSQAAANSGVANIDVGDPEESTSFTDTRDYISGELLTGASLAVILVVIEDGKWLIYKGHKD